jgi:hypothetical protein
MACILLRVPGPQRQVASSLLRTAQRQLSVLPVLAPHSCLPRNRATKDAEARSAAGILRTPSIISILTFLFRSSCQGLKMHSWFQWFFPSVFPRDHVGQPNTIPTPTKSSFCLRIAPYLSTGSGYCFPRRSASGWPSCGGEYVSEGARELGLGWQSSEEEVDAGPLMRLSIIRGRKRPAQRHRGRGQWKAMMLTLSSLRGRSTVDGDAWASCFVL